MNIQQEHEVPAPDPVARRLTIAGATTTALGAVVLSGMAASLAVAHEHVGEIRRLTAEAIDNNGATGAMRARAEELEQEAGRLEGVAIALGVAGGASVVTGVVLIAIGQRRHQNSFALAPVAAPGFAGFTLTGRF